MSEHAHVNSAMQSVVPSVPLVSVIMPVRNEEQSVRATIEAILSQDYPQSCLEVIVADGMSDDATYRVLQEMACLDQRVRPILNSGRIMAKGFNAALAQAHGSVIVMMGGHARMSTNYIRRCVDTLQRGEADCVGGVTRSFGDNARAKAIGLAMSSRFGVGGVAFRTGCAKPMYVDTVAFGAYSRSLIARLGKLDEEFVRNQDDEFNYRLREQGGRILLVPDIYCIYRNRSSFRALWSQYLHYGLWKVRVFQKHPSQMRLRHFVPPAVASAIGLLSILGAFSHLGLKALAMLLCTYLAVGLSFAATASRRALLLVPLVLFSFFVLHFSYGLGFLAGLVKFRHCWQRQSTTTPVSDVINVAEDAGYVCERQER